MHLILRQLQQHLSLAVLKLFDHPSISQLHSLSVATVLTVYGIETNIYKETYDLHRASDIALKDLHKKGRLIYEKRE